MEFLGLLNVLYSFSEGRSFSLLFCYFCWFSLSSFVSFADLGDVKASVAVISLIISNAAKFDVSGEVLSNELQQLGLPKGDLWLGFDCYKL